MLRHFSSSLYICTNVYHRVDSGTLSARRSPSQSRSSHRMLYGLVAKGRAYRRVKQCFSFKTTKCLLFVVKRVLDGWFRTDGYGEGMIRPNETLGGWPECVSATCLEV